MAEKTQDLYLQQGKTRKNVLRVALGDQIEYRAISSITNTAPATVSTTTPHGMLSGWPCVITCAKGMTEINSEPNKREYSATERKAATVIDPTTIALNSVNAVGFKPYTGSGVLQYEPPMDLTGHEARQHIRTKKGAELKLKCVVAGISGAARPTAAGNDGTVRWEATTDAVTLPWAAGTAYTQGDVVDPTILFSMTTTNGLIEIDTALQTLTRHYDAIDFTAITWKKGYYELEIYKDETRGALTIETVYSPEEGFVYLDAETTK